MLPKLLLLGLLSALLASSACQGEGLLREPVLLDASSTPSPTRSSARPAAGAAARPLPDGVTSPPEWLGQRILPKDEDGFGIAPQTPRILKDRRFVTHDFLPPPERGGFVATSGPIPRDVLRRSTWNKSCPVPTRELTYLTLTFWGFDEKRHTGEMIVNRAVAKDVESVFRRIYRVRWPIEEMRVTARRELHAPLTGDGNNTSAFVCRDARLSNEWSQHAYGLAIDVNPFHNPYVRDDLVLPELATAYAERAWHRPGMLRAGDPVTRAFGQIGWGWGGDWSSSKDWMHFSQSGT